MKNSKLEIRRSSHNRNVNLETRAGRARSVLECGGPPPLSYGLLWACIKQSARGLAHSKTWRLAFCFFILHSSFCLRALGQYSIDWYTIDGGGGTSTGGVYSVSGTIGQPDASQTPMTGGNYSLTGGFWALYAVQSAGAPLLRIFTTATNTAVIAWPSPSAGWSLQANADLTTTNWASPPEVVGDNGTDRYIIVSPPTGNRFYRLKKP